MRKKDIQNNGGWSALKPGPAEKYVLRSFERAQLGLSHEDGTLILQRDLFKKHYRTLLDANIEYGGWFGGIFDPGDGRHCYLRVMRAVMFPRAYFYENEVAFPPPSWFRSHATRGTWHLHRSALPYSVNDIYVDFSAVVVRGDRRPDGSIMVCVLSAVPFSVVRISQQDHGAVDEKFMEVDPAWREVPEHSLEIMRLKRFSLYGPLVLNRLGELAPHGTRYT